jgi:type I restriction enzyme S subunit
LALVGEWDTITLGEFAPLEYGKKLPADLRKPGLIRVVSSAGFIGWHDEALVPKPGITIGRKGTVGSLTLCNQPFWPIDTTFYIAEEAEKRDLRFTYYLLQSLGLEGLNSDSAVPGLNRNHAHSLKVRVPSLSQQRDIASILGALDDKIELNRRMNATLEAMARALFQSWFVDFDPVRAKAEGRQPVGMDAETAALFPDSFEDSVLGPIPKGWKVGNIDDLTNLHRQTADPGSKPTQLFAHYSLPAFDDGLRAEKVLGEQIKSNKYIVPNRAILVSKLNPHIPRVWLVGVGDNVPAICSTEFIVCTPTESSTAAFLYMLFTSEAFTTRYCGLVSGTTGSHQRVRPEDFRSMNVAIPNQSLVAAFTVFGGVLLSQSATLAHSNEVLRAARDTLLPKLLSGELRVGDVAA